MKAVDRQGFTMTVNPKWKESKRLGGGQMNRIKPRFVIRKLLKEYLY